MVTINSEAVRDAPVVADPKPAPHARKAIPQSPYTETVPDTLAIAEQELAGVAEEAQEEGYPFPSDLAFENARRLLPAIGQMTPRPVAVYADPDDGIAIDLSGGFGRSVGLHCEVGWRRLVHGQPGRRTLSRPLRQCPHPARRLPRRSLGRNREQAERMTPSILHLPLRLTGK